MPWLSFLCIQSWQQRHFENGWSNYWEYEHQKVGDCGSNSPFIPGVLLYGRRTDWWVATFTNPPRFGSSGFVGFYYRECCHSLWCATRCFFFLLAKTESLLRVLRRSEKLRNGFVTVVSKMGAYFHPVDWCSLCAAAFSVPPGSLRADHIQHWFLLATCAPWCV